MSVSVLDLFVFLVRSRKVSVEFSLLYVRCEKHPWEAWNRFGINVNERRTRIICESKEGKFWGFRNRGFNLWAHNFPLFPFAQLTTQGKSPNVYEKGLHDPTTHTQREQTGFSNRENEIVSFLNFFSSGLFTRNYYVERRKKFSLAKGLK